MQIATMLLVAGLFTSEDYTAWSIDDSKGWVHDDGNWDVWEIAH